MSDIIHLEKMNIEKVYDCKRCGYCSKYKADLVKHLKRKKVCIPVKQDIDVETLLKDLTTAIYNEKTYDCVHCGRKFNAYQNRHKHEKVCKQNPENMPDEEMVPMSVVAALQKEVLMLKEKMETFSKAQQGTTNTLNNSGTINNIHFHLKEFGDENMDALPHDLIRSLFMSLDFGDAVRNLYFDKDYPENHNIKLKSLKKQQMLMYKCNKWNVLPLQEGMRQIVFRIGRLFDELRRKHPDEALEDMDEQEFEQVTRELQDILDTGMLPKEKADDVVCALTDAHIIAV